MNDDAPDTVGAILKAGNLADVTESTKTVTVDFSDADEAAEEIAESVIDVVRVARRVVALAGDRNLPERPFYVVVDPGTVDMSVGEMPKVDVNARVVDEHDDPPRANVVRVTRDGFERVSQNGDD